MRDRSPANIARIQANSAATADACAQRSGDLLRYITTDQIVRDWDLIRSLLREPKLDFLGFSAGTWFGAHYATAFLTRIAARHWAYGYGTTAAEGVGRQGAPR